MSEETLQGLSCPNCGGTVPIPEGQIIVQCPYCEMRSLVRGERGILRYQVPQGVTRKNAIEAWRKFLTSSMAIARGASNQAKLTEVFLVYLPFWTVWARVAAWAFGQEKVGSGDDARYVPRERRVVQAMTWNGAACDVGEFGVTQVPTVEHALQPFDPEMLHNAGLVFEPVGSFSDARQAADDRFKEQVQRKASIDRLAQLFVRAFRRRYALVYHPLWVLRYLYRGRAFQVVVDGYIGKALYGKAPGNTLYRAAVLVAGMAIGAFLAIDVPAAILSMSDGDIGGLAVIVLGSFGLGVGLMFAGYRAFRHGEEYEYRSSGPKKIPGLDIPVEIVTQVKDIEEWTNLLS
jgi:DNA-directed RNA polymerase subunit RPC12/RpoP